MKNINLINIDRRLSKLDINNMPEAELETYVDQLKSIGEVVLHVWKQKNVLLNKHLEYRLCCEHNIPYRIVHIDLSSQTEAERWVVDNQLCHSHLSLWKRCQLAIKHFAFFFEAQARNNLTLSQGRGRKGCKKQADQFVKMDVNERLAAKARASKDTVVKVKFILGNKQYAPEGFLDKLDSEEITVNAAYHQVMRRKKHFVKAQRTAVRREYTNDLSKGIENNVICADALNGIKKIPDGSLSLAFQSPPFCVGKDYADNVSDSKPWKEHLDYLTKVFEALKPKFREGGRCVIEYQSIRTREKEDRDRENNRPIPAIIINMMQKLGYNYWTTIIWNKGHIGNRPQPMGSIGSPSCPVIRETHSNLFVFSVGGWTLPCETGDPSELSQKEYDELTQSVWNVHTEHRAIGSHVCPMPVELAERVVRLFSYKYDLCADVFGGGGTLAVAALRNSRRFVLVDKSPTYCADAKQRIEEEMLKLKSNTPINQAA